VDGRLCANGRKPERSGTVRVEDGSTEVHLVDTAEPLLVDAGGPGDAGRDALETGLAEVGLVPADIEHLLVTHPHTDHDGQVAALVETADPTVYAPVGVRDRLERGADDLAATVREHATAAGVPDVDATVEQAVDSLERNRACLPPDAMDVPVEDGDRIRAGELTFEAVHVPGHQVDQTAFLADGLLFAGDAAVQQFRPAALHVGFDEGHTESIDAFYDGLDALEDAAPDTDRVYPGHGPVFTDLQGTLERDRESLDQVVAGSRAAVETLGEATAWEATSERVVDVDGRAYTVFETVGALARLERQGVLYSTVEDGVRRYTVAD